MTNPMGRLPLDCRQVSVRYGRSLAVDQATFQVEPGQVYALLGRNGSGKTSLARCLLGHQKPTSGRIEMFGQDVWTSRQSLMHHVGVVTEEPDAPPTMTVRQLLRFCGGLYPNWDRVGVEDRLRRFRVPLDIPFGRLSRGQKGQVSLALALGPRPSLLVLDEPTLGLDAVARLEIYDELLGDLAERGTTVFISTHDLAGIEGLADRIGILHQGRLLVDTSLEDLKARHRKVSWAPRQSVDSSHLVPFSPIWIREGSLGGEAILTKGDATQIPGLTTHDLALEDLFIALVGAEVEVVS